MQRETEKGTKCGGGGDEEGGREIERASERAS